VPSHRQFNRGISKLVLGFTLAIGLLVAPISPAADAAAPTTVSLTFNDGFTSQYDYARPVLNQYGVKGTFYVASSWVDNKATGFMASWQLDGLYRDGHEIGGMGREHKNLTVTYDSDPAADRAYKRDQVCGDRERLAELGYDPQTFAYPEAATDPAAQSIVSECGYLSGRVSGGLGGPTPPYAESVPPANAYALHTANEPPGPISLTQLQDAVTTAGANGGGWLPIAFNQVCHQGTPEYDTCMGTFRPIDDAVLGSFLAWLQTQPDVSVRTVRSVMGAPTQPPLPPRPTLVSLTFDDGLKSQYNAATSVLDPRSVDGTFFVNSGAIDRRESGAVTWSQLATLKSRGHEIGGHTLDHANLVQIPVDQARHQVCDDRTRLIQMGHNVVSFAYPEAAYNAQVESIVQSCGYQSARTGGSVLPEGRHYAETLPPRDPYATGAVGTTDNGPMTLAWMKKAVTAAETHGGGWVQLLFHEVCFRLSLNYAQCMNGYRPVDSAALASFVDWLKTRASAGVQIRTVKQAIAFSQ
jgi:peptidoglycan/xylan/chitin deacetylase (PgdA/CDA1 family)